MGYHAVLQNDRAEHGSNRCGGVDVSESVARTPDQQFDEPPIQGQEEREREELRMLIIGFGTGLTVAGLFLLYVVLDFAHLL